MFTRYEKFVIAILTFLQFTIVLDFMIMAPLGAMMMPALNITPTQFGLIVSVYAFSAGASGLLAAGFADKFDRKKMLMFFYTGFLIGTLFCGLAPTYHFMIAARMITGIFGGVIGSIVFAMVTDLFPYEKRGRVMGVVQTAFAASQVMGMPVGLYISNKWGWHSPFIMIVIIGAVVGAIIWSKLLPVDGHLKIKQEKTPLQHLIFTATKPDYVFAFLSVALLSIGGFMMMPFSSAYLVNNLKISLDELPLVYLLTGICTIITGPYIGKLSDKFGKYRTFVFGTVVTAIMVVWYTHMEPSHLYLVAAVSAMMFVGIFSRIIPAQAIMSAVPDPQHRGSFMSFSSSMQQISGGLGSVLSGFIVVQGLNGEILHFDIVGYVLILFSLITLVMMYFLHKKVHQKPGIPPVPTIMDH